MQDLRVNRTHLKTERSCQELRRGGVVLLRLANGAACFLRSAELIADEDRAELQQLAGSAALLVLTHTRMDSLGRALPDGFSGASLSTHNLDPTMLAALAVDQPSPGLLGSGLTIVSERKGSLADYSTRLLRIAKLVPAALISRLPTRDTAIHEKLCKEHGIMIIEGRDVDQYISAAAQSLKIAARANVPLRSAPESEVIMFRAELGGDEHFAVVVGTLSGAKPPLVRLHSQCITGDILGSLKCDCGEQLEGALKLMAAEGSGVLVYLAQEGRDIGLLNKMRAYALQDNGLDTIDANHALGFESDERYFLPACKILRELGVDALRLITNNPEKIAQLEENGLVVTDRVPMSPASNAHNERYIKAKQDRSGHLTGY
jgi:GTP cyclohydrolase II